MIKMCKNNNLINAALWKFSYKIIKEILSLWEVNYDGVQISFIICIKSFLKKIIIYMILLWIKLKKYQYYTESEPFEY